MIQPQTCLFYGLSRLSDFAARVLRGDHSSQILFQIYKLSQGRAFFRLTVDHVQPYDFGISRVYFSDAISNVRAGPRPAAESFYGIIININDDNVAQALRAAPQVHSDIIELSFQSVKKIHPGQS